METTAFFAMLVVVLAAANVNLAAKLPANIKRCALTDPQLDECLREAVADALPKLKPGLPKLGVQPLDPLVIQEMRLSQGGDGPINMDLTFTNMTTTKILDGVSVKKVKFDPDTMTIMAQTLTPTVEARSKYVVKGRVLLLPIRGSGDSLVNLEDITTDLVIKGKRIQKDGKDYYDVTDVSATMTPEKMSLHMDNLFNGDKQLGDAMNRVLSDNWRLVFNEIGGSLNEAYSELFKRPARALFQRVPLNEIFPATL